MPCGWKGIVQAVVVVLVLQGAEGVSQTSSNGKPDINENFNKNRFAHPVGIFFDAKAPVVIPKITPTPGPITTELLRKIHRIGSLYEANTESFGWKVRRSSPRNVKYNLRIRDESTTKTATSNIDSSLSSESKPTKSVVTPIPTLSTRVRSTTGTTSTPATMADRKLLLDHTSIPSPNPNIPVKPLVVESDPLLEDPNAAPAPKVLIGATIGASAAAGFILSGIFIIWKHRRSKALSQMEKLDEQQERKIMA